MELINFRIRQKLIKKVKDLNKHGDSRANKLPITMIANDIGISSTTLRKILKSKNVRVSVMIRDKIEEWVNN